MDFLDNLVIPATTQHLNLLKIILVMAMLVFLPFFGMLLGGTGFSIIFNAYGRKIKNNLFIRLAKDIIDKMAINRFVGVGLGVLPLLAITFCYAQLLFEVRVISVSLLFVATLFLALAVNFIYSYQNTFQIESLIESLKNMTGIDRHELDTKIPENIADYEYDLMNANSNSGLYAFVLLLLSAFFFAGGTTIALFSDRYQDFQNIAQIFLSGATMFNFLFILISSVAVTGSAILFFFFSWQGGLYDMDPQYSNFVKKIAGNIAFTGAALLPVILFASFLVIPNVALSGSVFVYTVLAFVTLLLLCNFLYAVIKNSDMKYISAAFYLMIVSFGLIIMINQSAFGTASFKHLAEINLKAEELEKQKMSKTINTAGVDGEEIYNRICAACHKFDVKLVGPPYAQTVPTYNGDVKKLAGFILKPEKKNADYPPMPSPGLKPKEADAVAKYLIDKVTSGK
ncbi:MAG TPA: c-type cytochrome [Ignavibacteria bacterium]|nr:c-type cytochrome [Ignavibacteria bacterium]